MCAGRRAFAKPDSLLTEAVRQLTSRLCHKHHVEISWRTWLWKTFHAGLLYSCWRWAHFPHSLPAQHLPKMVVMAVVMVAVTAVATMVVAAVTTTVDAAVAVMMAPAVTTTVDASVAVMMALAMITAETVADADVVPMTARVMTMEAVAGAVAGVAAVLTMEVARAPEPLHES